MSTEKLNLHDKIAKLCIGRFTSLPKRGKPKETEWTILSCIVQQDAEKFEVVALGTGSKCIGQDKLSDSGDILNDCHAEIMCRRSFLRYLYENMLQNNICKFDPRTRKFRLNAGLQFHFFTTHVPCGDAAIFPKQNPEHFGNLVETQTGDYDGIAVKKIKLEGGKVGDIFRTGAKCLESDVKQDSHLEGADYHVTGVVRTKPGRGVRTLSVSCSDKLAKWCHLGVQGALLSFLLMEPVYFSSFTIVGGTPYEEEALRRALFNRLGSVKLEMPYHRSHLLIGQASFTFSLGKTDEKRPCPSSIAWLKTENIQRQMEVAVEGRRQGITKKQMKTNGKLGICKADLFNYFVEVTKQFKIEFEGVDDLTYKKAKSHAEQYQQAWRTLKQYFKVWTEKSDSLLQFHH